MTNELCVNAWIGNLEKFEKGIMQGEWVDYPISNEDENALMERIGINNIAEDNEGVWFTDIVDNNQRREECKLMIEEIE